MNIIETYVTNITKVEENLPRNAVRIVADFNCCGHVELQKEKLIHKDDYEEVKEKGYYLS